jgi:hypothetical protein
MVLELDTELPERAARTIRWFFQWCLGDAADHQQCDSKCLLLSLGESTEDALMLAYI